MAPRSRKRGARATPSPGRFARARDTSAGATPGDVPTPARGTSTIITDSPAPRGSSRARGAERDAAIRAQLVPLAPGERPLAITVAAIVAAAIGLGNLVLLAAGWQASGQSAGGVIGFAVIMLALAVAIWRRVYLAVLGFQALLGITLAVAGISLLFAANLQGALVSLAIIVPAGLLFWYLIRAMARLRIPEHARREADR